MLKFISKPKLFTPSEIELDSYEKRVKEVKLANSFVTSFDEKFNEIIYLDDLLSERRKSMERLLVGFNKNSSIMNSLECQTWSKTFKETLEDFQLHASIAAFKFPKHFAFE